MAVTAKPLLAGFVPEVTVTVRSVVFPAATELGLAVPTPVGFVGPPPTPKIEMLSMANACAFVVVVPETTE